MCRFFYRKYVLGPIFLLNHCNIYHDKDEAMFSIFNNSMGLVTIFLVYKLTISVCPKCHATIIPEFLNHWEKQEYANGFSGNQLRKHLWLIHCKLIFLKPNKALDAAEAGKKSMSCRFSCKMARCSYRLMTYRVRSVTLYSLY